MVKFILKRILYMIPVLLGVLLFIFIVGRAAGDPVLQMMGGNFTQEEYNKVQASLGLDKSYVAQFFDYLKGIVFHFDLGTDYLTKQPVSKEIFERFPTSLTLAMLALCLALVIGIPLGVLAAVKQNSVFDYVATILCVVFSSTPGFCVAFLVIIIFSVTLGWFPASGLESFRHWVLPVFAMGIGPISLICRTTRSNMLESLHQDFVRTERAKGVSERTVIFRHALKNSIIPVLTIISIVIEVSVGNSVVLESVFQINGVGSLLVEAVNNKNYEVMQGTIFILALLVSCVNLLVDIAYGLVDPRIRAQYVSPKKKLKQQLENSNKQEAKEVA